MTPPPDPGSRRPHTTRIVGGERRSVGDAPSIGRVSKMHYDPHGPSSRGSRQESQTDELTSRILRRWVVAGISLAALCIAGLAIWIFTAQRATTAEKAVAAQAAAAAAAETDGKVKTPVAPPTAQLEESARSFLKITDAAELQKIIAPTQQEPAAMLAMLQGLEAADGKVSKVAYLGPIPSITLPLESVLVTFDSGHNRIILFTPDAAGKWRIDFDAFARYTQPSWDTLLAGGAAEGTVRIYISPDSYFNGRFADEKAWRSFALASPDRETLMTGYTAKGSPCEKAILQALAANRQAEAGNPNPMLRMTLGIRHYEGDAIRQFEIVRAYSDDWATGPTPLDERFTEPKKP